MSNIAALVNDPDTGFAGLRAAPLLSPAEILTNMQQFVAHEALVKGEYVDPDGESAPGLICDGINACALGALWVSARVPYIQVGPRSVRHYPALLNGGAKRTAFLAQEGNEALAAAYDALRRAVQEVIDKHGLRPLSYDDHDILVNRGKPTHPHGYLNPGFGDVLESYFEGIYDEAPHERMAPIIARALELVGEPVPTGA